MYPLYKVPHVLNIADNIVGNAYRLDGKYWEEDWLILVCYDCAFKYNLSSYFELRGGRDLTTYNGAQYAGSPWAPCDIKRCFNNGNYRLSQSK